MATPSCPSIFSTSARFKDILVLAPTVAGCEETSPLRLVKVNSTVAKELLGYVRGKYSQVPIPGAEVTLNQADLISVANIEKAALIEKLRTDLDENSRKMQLQRKAEEAEAMKSTLEQVPLPIFIA